MSVQRGTPVGKRYDLAVWSRPVLVPTRIRVSLNNLYFQRLDPGRGMSAGQVSPAWWHATGMMILLDRYFAATGGSP